MDIFARILESEKSAEEFGFRWDQPEQILAQIRSECAEISEDLTLNTDPAKIQEEIGDLLHAVFSLCVFCRFDPQVTLENTLAKFERRFQAVKELAQAQGLPNLVGHSFDELMQFWDQAKKQTDQSV